MKEKSSLKSHVNLNSFLVIPYKIFSNEVIVACKIDDKYVSILKKIYVHSNLKP